MMQLRFRLFGRGGDVQIIVQRALTVAKVRGGGSEVAVVVLVLAFQSGDFILQHPVRGSSRCLCSSFVPPARLPQFANVELRLAGGGGHCWHAWHDAAMDADAACVCWAWRPSGAAAGRESACLRLSWHFLAFAHNGRRHFHDRFLGRGAGIAST